MYPTECKTVLDRERDFSSKKKIWTNKKLLHKRCLNQN